MDPKIPQTFLRYLLRRGKSQLLKRLASEAACGSFGEHLTSKVSQDGGVFL